MDLTPLLEVYPGDPEFYLLPPEGSHRVLLWIPSSHHLAEKPYSDALLTQDIASALSEAGVLRVYLGRLYGRTADTWMPLANDTTAELWLINKCIFTVAAEQPTWWAWNRNGEGDFLSLVRGLHNVHTLRSPPKGLARRLAAEGEWPGVRKAVGIIRHPYFGESHEEYLPAYRQVSVGSGSGYTHLKRLFACFQLPAEAHCALYTWLLGSFHAVSLDYARPILVLDSWDRARGKTQISSALRWLIDRRGGVKSARRGSDFAHEESVASMVTGRVEVIDNVDSRVDFCPQVAITASTGAYEARAKYAATASEFSGKLFVLNAVVGRVSFHEDLLSRILRVEIPGESQVLDTAPDEYAKAHRDEIIQEIIDAHAAVQDQRSTQVPSRASTFFRVALLAYAEVFGCSLGEALGRFKLAESAGKIYRKRALGSWMTHCRVGDPYPPAAGLPDDKLADMGFRVQAKPEDVGASALGWVLSEDLEWRKK